MSRRHPSDTAGPTQRQLRVGELVRRALADILMRGDVHDEVLGRTSITVGEVRSSPDLKIATAFVMPLGGIDAEPVLAALRKNSAEIRHLVAGQVDLKYAPKLRFELDETFDKMDETRRLLDDERVRRDVEG
ncbi:30S ribosome-binding factor RbfA [Pseudoroseicyclus sp. CXY001]|uniref:30S ribosome-binding factor RbfA n=1 Tax=Pseudoroseicyclus sp. CXY001 TaxID=3242492 RepID=UPI003571232F